MAIFGPRKAAWERATEGPPFRVNGPVPPGPVPPGSPLTQWGKGNKFAEQPLFDRHPRGHEETDLSMIEGIVSRETAAHLVWGRTVQSSDRVRHFVTSTLTEAGYAAYRTPTANIRNHVSVVPGGGINPMTDEAKVWWSRPDRVKLAQLTMDIVETESEEQ